MGGVRGRAAKTSFLSQPVEGMKPLSFKWVERARVSASGEVGPSMSSQTGIEMTAMILEEALSFEGEGRAGQA